MTQTPEFRSLNALHALMGANVPVVLESLPGAGKTSYLEALAEASNAYMHTMVAVTHDQTDFGGVPVPDLATARYRLLAGDWAHELSESVESGQYAWTALFLDEVNTAGRAVLSALLKVVDEKRVGSFQLPKSVRMLLALNPAEANGGVDLTPAMANRTARLTFDYPLKSWAQNIRDGFPLPDALAFPDDADIDAATVDVRAALGEYAVANPSAFDAGYPDDPAERSKAWPSRRSWTLAARAIGAVRVLGYGKRTEADVCTALVGRNAADGFKSFVSTRELLDPSDILANASTFDVPNDRADLLGKLLESVTGEAVSRFGSPEAKDAAVACATVFARVAEAGQPGIAATCVREFASALKSRSDLVTPEVVAALRPFKSVLTNVDGMSDAFNAGDAS